MRAVANPLDAEAFIAPTFGQRLGGRILDGALLFVVVFLLSRALHGTALLAIIFAISAGYDIIGVAVWGQTIGKRVVGTRVVSAVSDQLLPQQAVVRFLAYGGLAFVVSALGAPVVAELWAFVVILPVLRPPLHRGLHDLAARTIVIPTRTWSAR